MSKVVSPKKKVLWLTTASMNIEPVMNSLASVEDFDLEIDHFMFEGLNGKGGLDEAILFEVQKSKPDVIFYIGAVAGPDVPLPATFNAVQKQAPLVHMVFDGGCPDWWSLLKHYREKKCFSLTVNIDGSHDWPKSDGDITILCPIDPRPYNREVEKDIRLGFYGSSNCDERREVLEALSGLGLVTRERNETFGSYEPYADFMLRTKIVVNMAGTGSGKATHVKARVIESAYAGACLLEPKHSPTSRWFKPSPHRLGCPDYDYIEYSSSHHLVEILNNLEEETAKAVGLNLKGRVLAEHSPLQVYSKIFYKLGVTP